jgi:hypothetical protein
MSIRLIAKDLYRLHQEVERLEEELSSASLGEREELREQLRKLRAERDRMRRMLDGSKDPPPYRKPL